MQLLEEKRDILKSLIRIQSTELKERGVTEPGSGRSGGLRSNNNWETSSRTSSTPSCATFRTNNSGIHNIAKSFQRSAVPKLKLPTSSSDNNNS